MLRSCNVNFLKLIEPASIHMLVFLLVTWMLYEHVMDEPDCMLICSTFSVPGIALLAWKPVLLCFFKDIHH